MPSQHLCPFCGSDLVCQVSQGKPYWFCIHCHQEVPYAFCDNVRETELINSISHHQSFFRSGIDDLTHLANYSKFCEYLNQEWRRMSRDSKYLSLILCAVELKGESDLASKILPKIAQIIDKSVNRPGDFVARYRFQEFAILLPNTDLSGAETVKERISLSLIKSSWENEKLIFNKYARFQLGIASVIPPTKMTYDLLIIKAEQSLAKTREKEKIELK
jgi:diguanylate cyclase (GGDEF)-like protein